jgi:hypothetical protein
MANYERFTPKTATANATTANTATAAAANMVTDVATAAAAGTAAATTANPTDKLIDWYLWGKPLVMNIKNMLYDVVPLPKWSTLEAIIERSLNVHPERPFTPAATPNTFAYFQNKFETMLSLHAEYVYEVADTKFIDTRLFVPYIWHIHCMGIMFREMGPLFVQKNDNDAFLMYPPECSTDDVNAILKTAPDGAFVLRPSQSKAGKMGVSYKHSDDNDVHHVLITHHYQMYEGKNITGSIWTVKEEGKETLEPYPTLTELILLCRSFETFQCSIFDVEAADNFQYDKQQLLALPEFADVAADVAIAMANALATEAAKAEAEAHTAKAEAEAEAVVEAIVATVVENNLSDYHSNEYESV